MTTRICVNSVCPSIIHPSLNYKFKIKKRGRINGSFLAEDRDEACRIKTSPLRPAADVWRSGLLFGLVPGRRHQRAEVQRPREGLLQVRKVSSVEARIISIEGVGF